MPLIKFNVAELYLKIFLFLLIVKLYVLFILVKYSQSLKNASFPNWHIKLEVSSFTLKTDAEEQRFFNIFAWLIP